MTFRAVHWHEGMFLRPHHFQAAQRHWFDLSLRSEKWDQHYNWGLRTIELDLDALSNYRLVVRSLTARLHDGTLVASPEDGNLPVRDLKPAFEREKTITVFLAVPILNLGRANVAADNNGEGARFILDTQELEDENTGVNPQPIQVRLVNCKLLLSIEDHAGYEVLPIAHIGRAARAEATPELDANYIPPILACDAWKPLSADILEQIYNRIGQMLERQTGVVQSRGISFESQAAGDRLIIEQLRALNEAYALLGVLVFAQGVHPLLAYVELCRLVGQIAIFGKKIGPRTPDLPKYDHDDLGACFYAVKRYIDALLDDFPRADYQERPFIGVGLRMEVKLESEWLEPSMQIYVGVKSELRAEDCVRLLTRQGIVDMKIGSSDRVDRIFVGGFPGLKFTHSPQPPRALPRIDKLTYFQINRDSQKEEWQFVEKSLMLAVRLNEKRIIGNIEGQQTITVKAGGQDYSLQFTLYVLPQEE